MCPTLYYPMPYNPPDSSIHGISQARILKWVTISFSRGSSYPGSKPASPALQADSLSSEPPKKPKQSLGDNLSLGPRKKGKKIIFLNKKAETSTPPILKCPRHCHDCHEFLQIYRRVLRLTFQGLFFFFFFLAIPWGLQDLSSLTRDVICAPCSGSRVLTTGPPGNALTSDFLREVYSCLCNRFRQDAEFTNFAYFTHNKSE